jgi:hypothetical protein
MTVAAAGAERSAVLPAAPNAWRMTMSFVNDLKKFAIARLKERRHRQTVMYLNSLPIELRKDIGWIDGKRRFE